MERDAINELLRWKEGRRRKPLILEGARQVGKTWLVKEFARLHYSGFLDTAGRRDHLHRGEG